MSDLFWQQPTANPRQGTAAVGCQPTSTHGTYGSRRTPGKAGETYGKPLRARVHGARREAADVAEIRRELLDRQTTLQHDLGEWMAKLRIAEEAAKPWIAAFAGAHENCSWLLQTHGPGPRTCCVTRDAILAAYDARMKAGHAAHPYREAVKAAERVTHAIRTELKDIKEELA
jgi:hypothetical protein